MEQVINNVVKWVIARNEGPKTNGSEIGCLTPGKLYEVSYISYQISGNWTKHPLRYNPCRAEFFIIIKEDDFGKRHSIWNDYFLSSEEVRESRLSELGL